MVPPILSTNALLTSSTLQAGMAFSSLATSIVAAERGLGPQDAAALNRIESGRGSVLSAPSPVPSFYRRLTSGIACLILGALTLTGCKFDPSGLAPLDGGPTSDATDAMTTTDAADAGPVTGPSPALPANSQVLPPTRAYLYWRDGGTPAGRVITGSEICRTSGPPSEIDEDSECPNSVITAQNRMVVDPLTPQTNYLWKARTVFDDGSNSAWSALQAFSTDNSLVAWWRFNGDASDSGTMGINGALRNGAGFAAGLDAQALSVDGMNDYIDLGNNPALLLNGPLTVSAWVNANGIPTSADTGILNLGTLNYALTYHTNGAVYFYIGDGSNNISAPMSPNAWHQAVGVFDGTTNAGGMKLYLDNALVGTRASGLATTGATGDLWIGRFDMSYFRGLIDNVTIYNRALTDADVLNEHCATQAAGGVDPLPAACQP